ncbi:flagellar basal body rod protein FlgB [Stappia sp. GBMRC 2046]|uniref:Flagellar basal body rod protein FlgB n=1 Tax=Stappia sediminis TaxID=2692190 RepID=A0A7X3LRG1_9HYPH|nr:flagellar basal body rod protein FlgB [Stappia sediminis]MXN63729.1 flagellar basal body rod protein FlgB [Stappia sediminis]
MPISDLPVFQALKAKMQWHQVRQGVLSQNVANADTPGFAGKDLKEFKFSTELARTSTGLDTVTTNRGHLSGSLKRGEYSAKVEEMPSFETTPDGSTVVLEEQMMKVTQNLLDYQAATTLYSKGLGLIRTALSSRGA